MGRMPERAVDLNQGGGGALRSATTAWTVAKERETKQARNVGVRLELCSFFHLECIALNAVLASDSPIQQRQRATC